MPRSTELLARSGGILDRLLGRRHFVETLLIVTVAVWGRFLSPMERRRRRITTGTAWQRPDSSPSQRPRHLQKMTGRGGSKRCSSGVRKQSAAQCEGINPVWDKYMSRVRHRCPPPSGLDSHPLLHELDELLEGDIAVVGPR